MAGRRVETGLAAGGWVTHDDSDLPWHVEVRVSHVDGVPRLIGLRLEPRRDRQPGSAVVDTRSLRALPLKRLLQVGLRAQELMLGDKPGDEALADLAELMRTRERPSLRDSGSTEHLADVARVYRTAVAAGQPPRKVLVKRYGVHERTVDTWLDKARKHQPPLLEPARPGQRRAAATGTVK
jgi:hypothetical protein